MTNEEAFRILAQRYRTPQNLVRCLGLDEDNEPDDDTSPLAFLRARMSPEDLDAYLNALLIDAARRGADDRKRAQDDLLNSGNNGAAASSLRRAGNLPVGLRSGITSGAPAAHDSAPTDASRRSFEQMFATTHMPGVA